MPAVYDFTAKSLAGDDVPLKQFEGKVLLIVNTASKCGFTQQYEGLEALHRELSPRGFAVDPLDRFLICAGQSQNTVGVYAIDPDSGALALRYQTCVGINPNWVETYG